MASTACSEACLAVYLHAKSFSVPSALAAHVTAPLSSGHAARPGRRSQLGYFLFGSVARLLGYFQNGHRQLGMKRTTTSSLVAFHPFQPGRNKFRRALTSCCVSGAPIDLDQRRRAVAVPEKPPAPSFPPMPTEDCQANKRCTAFRRVSRTNDYTAPHNTQGERLETKTLIVTSCCQGCCDRPQPKLSGQKSPR